MQTRVVVITTLVVGTMAGPLAAQDTVFFPATDRIAIRADNSIPTVDVAPGVHVRTIVGATGSVSLGEFDSAAVAPLHHHTREQTDVGLTGNFDVTIGDRIESLRPGTGMIIPPDVPHSIANHRRGVATVLEFHTVRRPDLVPPRPTMSFPVAPAAAATPRRPLVVSMEGGSGSLLTGQTCMMRSRRVRRPVDVHPDSTETELFVFVASGAIRLRGEAGGEILPAGTLIIVPARVRHVEIAPAGAEANLVEFRVTPR